jgi:hypothetical protein
MDADSLRALTQKIADNPDAVYDLSPEEAIELQKYLNPLGNIISEDKEYVNLSIVNWTEQYMRKFLMTSLIGYMYRLQSEYEPEDEIEASRKRMEEKLQNATEPSEIAAIREEHAQYSKLLTKTARAMILKFLNRNFNFNPDHHLRASHSGNKDDPERKPKAEEIVRKCKVAEDAPNVDAKLEAKPEGVYKYMRDHMLNVYQTAVETSKVIKAAVTTMLDPMVDLQDKQGILLKKYKALLSIITDMKKIADPIASAETLAAWKVDPPVDVFHQFDRYVTNHYEQLREVCVALYSEKPDIEYAVIFYKSFDNPESAAQHRKQNEARFRAEVLTLENTGVSLIGPFKENRARVDFYNKHVEIMKLMMEQMETDHKLGKDLMEKQVKKKKRQNIAQDGPDAQGLRDYSKAMNTMAELGAKKVLTREEQDKMNEAHAIKEDFEVPDDAIQVDMFFPQTDAEGNTVLAKKKMYTQAEAPLHLQEGSEYHDRYQPVRGEGTDMNSTYVTKTIISKTGERKEIKTLAQRDDKKSRGNSAAESNSNNSNGAGSGKDKEDL